MGRKSRDRKSRRKDQVPQTTTPSNRKKVLTFALPVVLVIAAGVVAYFVFFHEKPSNSNESSASVTRKAQSLDELLAMSPEQLCDVDIAEMNLLCATGLPGAEKLDVDKAFARLNEYARRVRYWTDQSIWDFRQNPGKFENSEAKFRVLLLISVLQKDFSVHYNERGERNCDFSNAKNAFLHGMIDDTNGGTCASMPVMYVAVGRRLGYPMSLVLAKTHIFARWEDPVTGERFNIEGTNPRFDDHPDSYYRKWPYPISDAELKHGWYLKSLTGAEELAVFLHNRGNCLLDNKRFHEAQIAFAQARRLAPHDPLAFARLASALDAELAGLTRKQLAAILGVGPTRIGAAQRRSRRRILDPAAFGPPMVYPDPLAEINRINAINRANMRRLMQPPHVAKPPSPYGPQPRHQPGRP